MNEFDLGIDKSIAKQFASLIASEVTDYVNSHIVEYDAWKKANSSKKEVEQNE